MFVLTRNTSSYTRATQCAPGLMACRKDVIVFITSKVARSPLMANNFLWA